jgi:hypothetical protein
VIGWIACAPDAAQRRDALASTDLATALDACGEDESCRAAAVREHPAATGEACATLAEPRWRAECHFAVAEHRARAGDRQAALIACGQAGDYYNECLYHAWTFELQATVEGLGRAVEGVERARPVVAYWSDVGTIGSDAEGQIWRDWWYFAHARNKPATLAACGELTDAADRERCDDGTRMFVLRAVAEEINRAETPAAVRDRACRGETAAVLSLMGKLYTPDPTLDEQAEAGRALACGQPGHRPWNPIFRDRRSPG